MFVDMDSFFASAEQHLRPELRGRPVGIIPLPTDATCVIAASYDAKKSGVKTGTRVPDARRLCPGIALVKARPAEYVRLHQQVAEAIERCVPIEKTYSIDEWAIRLVPAEQPADRAMALAQAIRRSIHESLSPAIGCSVGIAPTRLLAKVACELAKPGGVRLLHTADLPEALRHLEIDDLAGISSGMVHRLEQHGIRTIDQLWNMTRQDARAAWGSVVGERWWNGFHGVDEPEIVTARGSFGHAHVLEPKFRTDEGARRMTARLVCRLGVRLRHEGYAAGRLSIEIIATEQPKRFFAERDLPDVQETPALLEAFSALWSRRRLRRHPPPMRVGAMVTRLRRASQVSAPLFEAPRRDRALSQALDQINQRYGRNTLYFGAIHGCTHHMDDKIAFGRIPKEETG